MNYYKHHIGDYAAATAHLSWDEDIAYTRLIRVYYQHEKPIPEDIGQACRLVRASTPAQKRAVESVLREFFVLQSSGWHQKRCDAELANAAEKSEKNRVIGRKGGRPPKETQTVSENNPDGFCEETQTVKKETQATSHKPIASNQEEISNEISSAPPATRKIEVPPWLPAEAWQGYVQMRVRIKRPLTDRAKALAIAELDKLRQQGHDPSAVLDQSTLNSWQGLFPLRESDASKPQRSGVHIGKQDYAAGWGS